MRTTLGAFLGTLAHYPDESQTLLVEIVGAGPRAMERRDRALEAVAQYLVELNEQDAERGATPRFASPDDAFAIVGAVVELASRQIRTGVPGDIRELEPVVERLSLGLIGRRPAVVSALAALEREIVECRLCPRLVAHRERMAHEKVARHSGTGTTGAARSPASATPRRACSWSDSRPRRTAAIVPGASSPATRAGNWLFAALHRAGFANQPVSRRRATTGSRLRECIRQRRREALRAARESTHAPAGRSRPLPPTISWVSWRSSHAAARRGGAEEGRSRTTDSSPPNVPATTWYRAPHRASPTVPRTRYPLPGLVLVCSYHPSQQNTFTGKLTRPISKPCCAARANWRA